MPNWSVVRQWTLFIYVKWTKRRWRCQFCWHIVKPYLFSTPTKYSFKQLIALSERLVLSGITRSPGRQKPLKLFLAPKKASYTRIAKMVQRGLIAIYIYFFCGWVLIAYRFFFVICSVNLSLSKTIRWKGFLLSRLKSSWYSFSISFSVFFFFFQFSSLNKPHCSVVKQSRSSSFRVLLKQWDRTSIKNL